MINGLAYPGTIGGSDALVVTAAHRDRLQQTAAIYEDTTAGDIVPEDGTTYTIRVYGEEDDLIHTEPGLSEIAWTYTVTTEETDAALPAGTAGDPYWANVIMLLHMDGTDASTTIVDEAGIMSWTAVGNAQLDTAQYVFGSASALFDGNGDYLSAPSVQDLNQTDFTIEARVRFATGTRVNASQAVISQWESSTGSNQSFIWSFTAASTSAAPNAINFGYRSGGSTYVGNTVSYAFSFDTWYAVAVTRTANVIRFFVDGILVYTSGTLSNTHNNSSLNYWIGRVNLSSNYYGFNGWIDELRLTNGVARYTADYTVDTIPCFSNVGTAGGYRLNGRLRVKIESERDSRVSFQHHDVTIYRKGYGFNYGLLYGGAA